MASFIGDGCVSILESFEFDNVREMVDLERVEALLKTTDGITSPKRIKLSNKSFSKEAALALSQVISGFNEIKTADLSYIIAGRPEMEALITLSTICGSLVENNLVSVNLSDNALGKKGVHACKDVLVGGKLEVSSIDLEKAHITHSTLLVNLNIHADTVLVQQRTIVGGMRIRLFLVTRISVPESSNSSFL